MILDRAENVKTRQDRFGQLNVHIEWLLDVVSVTHTQAHKLTIAHTRVRAHMR